MCISNIEPFHEGNNFKSQWVILYIAPCALDVIEKHPELI